MAEFNSPSGDLQQIYVDDYALIDQYAATGSLWSWGRNADGQLGDNTAASKSSPVQTVAGGTNWRLVALGDYHSAAIKTDGTLWLWGFNNYGQLGTNDRTNRSSPVQTVAAGTNWKQVSGSASYSTISAIKTDGTLWLWGSNSQGQLGTNNTTDRSSPVQTVSGGTNWRQISTTSFNAAIKTDGTLWVWGSNLHGELGTNDITSRSSPVQTVSGGTNWRQCAAGAGYIAAAIKTDGTLWTWGWNNSGQLGTNNTTDRSSPAQTIAAATNWQQISCGYGAMAAIKTDGTLWLWGDNGYGQLGTNNVTKYSSPVQTVAGGTNWKQVSCSSSGYVAAIKTDGTLWTWGRNADGQLGTNDRTNRSSPVQTVSGGTNWKQVAAGYATTMAVYFYDANNLYPGA